MKRLPTALSTNPKSLPDRGNFCIRVALDVPLQKLFEYSLPEGISARVGDRVAVRFGAQQKIGVEESLRAYTIDAAYAGFSEESLGSLTPGKLADLVILDRDLFMMPAHGITDAHVNTTIVGGKVVYQREDGTKDPAAAQ